MRFSSTTMNLLLAGAALLASAPSANAVDPVITAEAIAAGVPLVEELVVSLGGIIDDEDTYRSLDDQYIFFEGNHCYENLAGSFWARWDNHPDTVNAKEEAFFENDEARSVLIQGPIRKGEVLHIWDSPDGGADDDHTRIEMMRDMELGDGYCVGSFEETYEDGTVRVSYTDKGGLDGKVSLVANFDAEYDDSYGGVKSVYDDFWYDDYWFDDYWYDDDYWSYNDYWSYDDYWYSRHYTF